MLSRLHDSQACSALACSLVLRLEELKIRATAVASLRTSDSRHKLLDGHLNTRQGCHLDLPGKYTVQVPSTRHEHAAGSTLLVSAHRDQSYKFAHYKVLERGREGREGGCLQMHPYT